MRYYTSLSLIFKRMIKIPFFRWLTFGECHNKKPNKPGRTSGLQAWRHYRCHVEPGMKLVWQRLSYGCCCCWNPQTSWSRRRLSISEIKFLTQTASLFARLLTHWIAALVTAVPTGELTQIYRYNPRVYILYFNQVSWLELIQHFITLLCIKWLQEWHGIH